MKKAIKLSEIRKERKNINGTFFAVVNQLFADAESCPTLKAILPASKSKAKTGAHEKACKDFAKFGQTLTRKVSKLVDGVRCTTETTYTKNT